MREGQKFYVESVLVAQGTDTDARLAAAGRAGLRLSSDFFDSPTKSFQLDNFKATDAGTATAPPAPSTPCPAEE